MADGTVTIDIMLNDGSVVKGVANLQRSLDSVGSESENAAGKMNSSFSTGIGFAVAQKGLEMIISGIKTLGSASIGSAANFEQTMNMIQANTNASSSEMSKLNTLAKDLGASTKFSAGEAATAILELTKAGLTPAQVQAGALKSTMDLAAASGMDLGTAANVTANALNTFHLDASKANDVANALAGGANASSADVSDLAQALGQVGPGAVTAGMSLNETVGALAAFAQNGIKGSDAGTSLKTMLQSLIPQSSDAAAAMKQYGLSFVDANGNIDDMTTIAGKLHDKLGGLSEAQKQQALTTIFGSDASRAAAVLMNEGADGISKYIKATEDQTAAQKMADAYMKGFKGTVEQLRGALETVAMSIGGMLLPPLTLLAKGLSVLIDWLSSGTPAAELLKSALTGVGVGLTVLLAGVTAFAVLPKITAAFSAFNAILMANPIVLVVAAVAALAAGLTIFFTKTETGRKAWEKITSAFKNGLAALQPFISFISGAASSAFSFFSGILDKVGGAISGFHVSALTIVGVLTTVGTALLGVTGPFGIIIGLVAKFIAAFAQTHDVSSAIQMVVDNIVGMIDTISAQAPKFIKMGADLLIKLINGITSALPQIVSTITQIINELTTALTAALPQIIQAGIQLIMALIQGVVKALPQIVTAITQVITALMQALVGALPLLIQAGIQILTGLIQGIVTALPMIIQAVIQLITALINALISMLPQIIQAGIQLILALIQGVIQILPQLVQAGIQLILALINAILQNLPTIIAAGVQLILALVNGVIQVLPQLVAAGINLIVSLIGAILQNLPAILSAGMQLLTALITGIGRMIGSLLGAGASLMSQLIGQIGSFAGQMLSKGGELIQNVANGISNGIGGVIGKIADLGSQIVAKVSGFASDLVSAGGNLIQGFANGIADGATSAIRAAANAASDAVEAVKNILGIHSPSRVFRDEVGKFIPAGIAVGITANTGSVISALNDMNRQIMSVTPESALNIGNTDGLAQAKAIMNNTYSIQSQPEAGSVQNTFETTIIAPEQPSTREYIRLQKNAWRDMAYEMKK